MSVVVPTLHRWAGAQEARRSTYDKWLVAINISSELCRGDPNFEAIEKAANEGWEAKEEAIEALFAIAPTTPEGLLALIEAFLQIEHDYDSGAAENPRLARIFAGTKSLLGESVAASHREGQSRRRRMLDLGAKLEAAWRRQAEVELRYVGRHR